jgi:hypothetical protein
VISAQAGGCGASVGSALQSKSESREAMRLRRHDWLPVEQRFEKSQKWLQIRVDGEEIRDPADA